MIYTATYDNIRLISVLVGKRLIRIKTLPLGSSIIEELLFICDDGTWYQMGFDYDGHPNTYVEDIVGDLEDLIGSPILIAREDTSENELSPKAEDDERYRWTFYNIATERGCVTIRWYAGNEGNYSAAVDFAELLNSRG